VLGHEVVARVVEVGAEVERVRVGDRVVMDPTLSCGARGFDPACASCVAGLPGTCARMGDAALVGRGMFVGAHKDLPGGWGAEMICHESQLYVVPEGLSDETAALCEPLSVGMHAVLQTPLDGDAALVIGSGPIALGTIWALRAAGFEGTVLAQTKRKHEAELAKKLGATDTVTPAGARDALLATGARAYKPIIGDEVYAGGGFPLVFDCVGSEQSLAQALRYVTPRGRIVLLGCAATLHELDLSFLWAREVTMQGFLCYGREKDGAHTFDFTLRRLAETKAPVADMVTHRFPIARYREALSVCANRAKSGAVKVLFTR
jgi:threonine dehydrogenase-like Zn-dependent dehydrogenase